jgi:hypothetical protein
MIQLNIDGTIGHHFLSSPHSCFAHSQLIQFLHGVDLHVSDGPAVCGPSKMAICHQSAAQQMAKFNFPSKYPNKYCKINLGIIVFGGPKVRPFAHKLFASLAVGTMQ